LINEFKIDKYMIVFTILNVIKYIKIFYKGIINFEGYLPNHDSPNLLLEHPQ